MTGHATPDAAHPPGFTLAEAKPRKLRRDPGQYSRSDLRGGPRPDGAIIVKHLTEWRAPVNHIVIEADGNERLDEAWVAKVQGL